MTTSSNPAPVLKLSSGGTIPQIGLGTWPMDDAEAEQVVARAIRMGYRLIDTATVYGNETGVGRGLRNSGVTREELFVTTKLPGNGHGREEAHRELEASLERLGLDYVDLYLIHWPLPSQDRFVEAWKGLIELQKEGKARSIGVSNFLPHHTERLIDETGVTPDVNQVQLFPGVPQQLVRQFDEQHGIVTEGWSPLGSGANEKVFGASRNALDQPVVTELAEKYGRTAGQVILRWHVQNGVVPVPKSSNPERLAQNIDVFSFSLDDDEMAQIDAIDHPEQAVDPDNHDE